MLGKEKQLQEKVSKLDKQKRIIKLIKLCIASLLMIIGFVLAVTSKWILARGFFLIIIGLVALERTIFEKISSTFKNDITATTLIIVGFIFLFIGQEGGIVAGALTLICGIAMAALVIINSKRERK